jgi:hypothetical protein
MLARQLGVQLSIAVVPILSIVILYIGHQLGFNIAAQCHHHENFKISDWQPLCGGNMTWVSPPIPPCQDGEAIISLCFLLRCRNQNTIPHFVQLHHLIQFEVTRRIRLSGPVSSPCSMSTSISPMATWIKFLGNSWRPTCS